MKKIKQIIMKTGKDAHGDIIEKKLFFRIFAQKYFSLVFSIFKT